MRVTPRSEEELNRLLEPGLCDFEITSAKDTVSKNGNEQIHLILKVWDKNGRQGLVHDYLVDIEVMAYKIRHFAYSVGLGGFYEKGEIASVHCVGKTGKAMLKIQKDKDKQYPDKNVIQDYFMVETPETLAALQASKPGNEKLDDDIPF